MPGKAVVLRNLMPGKQYFDTVTKDEASGKSEIYSSVYSLLPGWKSASYSAFLGSLFQHVPYSQILGVGMYSIVHPCTLYRCFEAL